jgi:hypothetical protein
MTALHLAWREKWLLIFRDQQHCPLVQIDITPHVKKRAAPSMVLRTFEQYRSTRPAPTFVFVDNHNRFYT